MIPWTDIIKRFEGRVVTKDLLDEIYDEVSNRLSDLDAYCTCSVPHESIKKADETFLERRGCLRCDKWRGPVRLRGGTR